MHVLHVLIDGPDEAAAAIAKLQANDAEVETLDLSRADVSYEELVDRIFASDKVISW